MPAKCRLALYSLPPLIDMWGQSLDAHCIAQEAREIEARAALTATLSSNTPFSKYNAKGKKVHPTMVQHGHFLLIFLLCSKTMGDQYSYVLKLQVGHQCFSNIGCCRSGMNSYVWTTFPQQQLIPQTWCHLSVTGQRSANAWYAT